jgi:REP element-mobilizing transposase RayT
LIQHITFHLADSLPREAIARMERELADLSDDRQAVERRQRIQSLLDSGLGSCILRQDNHARVVEESLLFGDGERYRLLAWVIMPNHVHVLIEQKAAWPLAKVVQSWKRHTSREIHRCMGLPSGAPSGSPSCTRQRADCKSAIPAEYNSALRADYKSAIPAIPGLVSSPLWQRDYWDRFIRNERHLVATVQYIENNPVVTGLVSVPEKWRWGSAWFGRVLPSPTRRSGPSPTRRSRRANTFT